MDVLIMDMGDGVKGGSSLEGFAGKLELLSFSHGVAMQITGEAGERKKAAGKPNHQDLTVTRYLDGASPILNQSCCQGKVFPKVEIIIGSDEGGRVAEWMRYTVKDAIISSVSTGGGGGDRPVETLTLSYNYIAWKFTGREPASGSQWVTEGKWDLARNAAS